MCLKKLCGCQESCFERGECWGHYEGVMCKHLGEKEIDSICESICELDNSLVDTYTTHFEYATLLAERNFENK
jgi:hypothetical protein